MLISILSKILGVVALALGIRSGYRWWSNSEEKTIRIGTRASNLNNSFIDLFIYCFLGYLMWVIPLVTPLLIIKKIGWLPVIIIVAIIVGIVILFGGKSTDSENNDNEENE